MISAISVLAPTVVVAGMLFSNVDIGSVLPNPTLQGLDGVERSLLSEGQVGAFIFVNPEQAHSLEVLQDLGKLREEMALKPVRWICVVSDRFSEDAMRSALEEADVDIETVVDPGDQLYGDIGVRLYPSVGIADQAGNLQAYLPFTKVNYLRSVQVNLLHVLGEIDDDELEAALRPKSVDFGGNGAAASRNIRFARMLFDAGKLDNALIKAKEAVAADPESAEALALVGLILVEQGDCVAAQESLQAALAIDPENATAKSALERCG